MLLQLNHWLQNRCNRRFPFTEKFRKFRWKFPSQAQFARILRAKIKDLVANSLELVKLVNGTRISIGKVSNGKKDYLFRRSVAPGNFPLERHEKLCSIYFPTGISGLYWSMENAQYLTPTRLYSISGDNPH